MRLYAVADIHADIEKIRTILAVIEHQKPDILISAGDLFNYTIRPDAAALLSRIRIPFVGIRGNSDLKVLEPRLLRTIPLQLLDEFPRSVNGISMIGLNGTIPIPFLSKITWFESAMVRRIAPLVTSRTVVVAHPPPRGYTDRVMNRFSAGSPGLSRLIDISPPMMVLCGHIHEQAGIDYFKTAPIINCAVNKTYSGVMIECDNDRIRDITLVPAKP